MDLLKDISLLPVCKNHIPEIIDLLQSVSKYKPSYSDALEKWDNFSNQNNSYALVIIYDNKVVGYGSIFFVTKIRGGKMAQIDEMVIHPDYKCQGLGRLLLKTLCDIAIKEKSYKVSLSCHENMIPFYKKNNFVQKLSYLNRLL